MSLVKPDGDERGAGATDTLTASAFSPRVYQNK